MFKKLICFFLIFAFSSTTLFAQSAAQLGQMKKYLDSPQGKKILQSKEGKELVEKYGKQGALGLQEEGVVGILGQEEEEEEVEALSELELALYKDLILEEKEPLRQYGYNAFRSTVASFTPPDDVPVGPDYIIGPGDSFNVTLWGITEGIFKVEVNREGDIVLPKVGVVKVVGLTYGELKPFIEQQLGRYYESVNVGITIDTLRTIRVYVVGEVARPGSYSISSLSTVYSALFAAGGPTKNGTMRKIQIIRNGQKVARVDLYRFLLKGDKSQDRNLQSGDTIFVPIIGPVAGIAGAVYRPAIYEIKGKADLRDFIYLAGGFLPTGHLSRVQVKRIEAHEKKVVRDQNVSRDRTSRKFGFNIQNMDLVEIFPIVQDVSNQVYLEGAVQYPGSYEYEEGMRIADLLSGSSIFAPNAYLSHIEVIRIDRQTKKAKIHTVDFKKLLAGDDSQNIILEPLDRIMVASEKAKFGKIVLMGEIQRPGQYTFAPGEKLASVLKRAGGFTGDAYLFGARFYRSSVRKAQAARSEQLIAKLEEEILLKGREVASGAMGEAEQSATALQLSRSQDLLELLRNKKVEGRVIVNLEYPLEKFEKSKSNIELEDKDWLQIPAISKVVMVVGEVYNPSSVVYDPDRKGGDYLRMVGGVTRNADKGEIYVIRADGSVLSRKDGVNVLSTKLFPGDAIIVPQVVETAHYRAQVKDWTHWFYEAALAFAVIATYLRQ